MAIEKQIKTKISLRYLEYATWSAESFKTEKPLKGEVWLCAIPEGNASATNAPTMLFKVGDGVNTFGNLKWGSALAADVYGWAKKQNLDLADLPDIPVVDTENGKFVTDVEWDADNNQIIIHRGNVALDDISDKEKIALSADLGNVSTLKTTAKTAVGAINEHDAEIGNLTELNTTNKNNLVVAINEALQAVETGGTGSVVTLVKEDKTTYDEYTLKQGGKAVGDKVVVGKNSLTMKAGSGLSATETTFSSNGTDAPTFEVSHADTSSVANVTKEERKYVSGVTFDDFGHVTAIETSEELDTIYKVDTDSSYAANDYQYKKSTDGGKTWTRASEMDINVGIIELTSQSPEITIQDDGDGAGKLQISIDNSSYKKVQTAVAGEDLTGAKVLGSLTQDANGDISYTTRTLTAADLGLDTVMHFIGAYATAPTKAFVGTADERNLANGDVYLNTANATEYVYSGGKWHELGNESAAGSHALKTIKIEGTGYMTGGGTLEQDRTIDLTQATKDKIDHGETAYGWGNHANAGYAANTDLTKVINGTTPVAKATNADNADKLDNHDSTYFATAESVTDITKDNGTIDSKIAAYNTSKNFGDIITHNVNEFATKEQGEKADNAVQSATFAGTALTKTGTKLSITKQAAQEALGWDDKLDANGWETDENRALRVENGSIHLNDNPAEHAVSITEQSINLSAGGDSYSTSLTANGIVIDYSDMGGGRLSIDSYEIQYTPQEGQQRIYAFPSESGALLTDNSKISADQFKANKNYEEADAEIWVLDCNW